MKKWFNVDITQEFNAPINKVFACLLDIEKWPTWTGAISHSCALSTGEWRKGFKLKFSSPYLPIPVSLKVLEYKENECIAWGIKIPLFFLIHRFTFTTLGKKNCRIHSIEYSTGCLGFLSLPLARGITRLDYHWMKDMVTHINFKG